MEVSRNQRHKMNSDKTNETITPMVVGLDRKVRGLDEITKGILNAMAVHHPRKAINLKHQFLDGTNGNPCGFVPNDFDGGTVCIIGQWWKQL